MMTNLVLFIAVSAFASSIATFLYLKFATKFKIVDKQNSRSLHSGITPRGGGVGIWIVCTLIMLLIGFSEIVDRDGFFILIVTGSCCAAVGFIDDLFSLSVVSRLILQLLIAGAYGLAIALPSVQDALLAATVIICCLNLTNFMDGADGLVASQSSTVFMFAAFVYFLQGMIIESHIAAIVAGSALGFLYWNWQPSRIFMGDAGSYFLGFHLGAIVVHSLHNERMLSSVLIVLMPLYVDAIFTVCARASKGEQFWSAHNKHLYQRCIRSGISHSQTSLRLLSITLGFVGLALWAYFSPYNAGFIVAIAAALAATLWFFFNNRFRISAKIE